MLRKVATKWFSRFGLSVVAGLLWCATGAGQVITEFPVESVGGIALGPDGAMWFTEDHALGRIDASGTIAEFPVQDRWPSDVSFGPDGNLWFTAAIGGPSGTVEAWICRMTPSGVKTDFPVPDAGRITEGPDGNLWFTEVSSPRIGRITTSGTWTEFALPTPSPAVDITAGPDGNLWFTKESVRKIGRITPSGAVTEFDVAGGTPAGIAAGPDGNIWFTARYERWIGRITPTGEITRFPSSSAAYAIVAGADGNLWAAGNRTLKRITPSGSMTDFPMPTVGQGWYQANPSALAAAPDGSIWVADYETLQIVRFSLDRSACLADPTTLCLNGGRFRVTTDWRRRDGSTGQGRAVDLTANSGYFWFFDAGNIEVVVKILDGCSTNQHHWAFAAGLTNVEVTMTVTDTYTGLSKVYTNPVGTGFTPVLDTEAFAECP
jgi:streptogramin lyase